MPALVTITHRRVEHSDPHVAGFTDGWWWSLTTDNPAHDYVESATATREDSERLARDIAAAYGYPEVTVRYGDELLDRAEDEQRVRDLVSED